MFKLFESLVGGLTNSAITPSIFSGSIIRMPTWTGRFSSRAMGARFNRISIVVAISSIIKMVWVPTMSVIALMKSVLRPITIDSPKREAMGGHYLTIVGNEMILSPGPARLIGRGNAIIHTFKIRGHKCL